MALTKADYRLGAVWRVGLRRKLPKATIEALLVARCALSAKQASQLVGHWLTTEPFRLNSAA